MEIKIERNPNPAPKPTDESKLGFGKVFTDHMFLMDWDRETGWHDARIVPFGNLSLHPGTTALHYALEVLRVLRHIAEQTERFRPSDRLRMQSVSIIPQSVSACRLFLKRILFRL